MGARNLFDEIYTWEERESLAAFLTSLFTWCTIPSLKISFCEIFGPSTMVEEVFMCNELEHVEAQVLFPSKLEAAEAFREFYGRNIYDGCCQMIIMWGIFQYHSTTAHLFSHNTTITMESVHNTISVAAIVCQVINIMPSNHRVEVTTSTIFDEESIINEGPIYDEEPAFNEEPNNISIGIILSHNIDITEISSPSMWMLLSIVSIFAEQHAFNTNPNNVALPTFQAAALLQ
jgi:hypothetical protein